MLRLEQVSAVPLETWSALCSEQVLETWSGPAFGSGVGCTVGDLVGSAFGTGVGCTVGLCVGVLVGVAFGTRCRLVPRVGELV